MTTSNDAIQTAFLKAQPDKNHPLNSIHIEAGNDLSESDVKRLFATQKPFLLTNVSLSTKVLLGKTIGGNTEGQADYLLVKPIKVADNRTMYHTIESANYLNSKATTSNAEEGQNTVSQPVPVAIILPDDETVLNSFAETSVRVWEIAADTSDIPVGEPLPWSHTYSYNFQPHASEGGGFTPPSDQTMNGDVTYEFQILLNESQEGNFQYIVGTMTGIWTPNPVSNEKKDKGWGTAYLEPTMSTPAGFFDYQSSPENANNTQEVTTSVGFEVGYQTASFNYSQSKTETLTDWAVEQNPANNWTYYMATPYDGRTSSYPNHAYDDWPALTISTNQFECVAVWKNNEMASGTVDISTDFHVHANYIKKNWIYFYGYHWYPTFTVNLTDDEVSS